jgi:predicted HTH transcriptional regulator
MWEEFVAKGAYLRHPLIEDKVQAEIMAHVRDEARPVSRARLAEALNPSRGKISAEVGRLIEAGLLAEEGFADSEGGRRATRCSASLIPQA